MIFRDAVRNKGGPVASFYGEDASRSALHSAYLAADAQMDTAALRALDLQLFERLKADPAFVATNTLVVYQAEPGEVDLSFAFKELLEAKKSLYIARRRKSFDEAPFIKLELDEARKTIHETPADVVDGAYVLLVPGLCFDAHGARVAFAAGVHDALIPGASCSLGLCRQFQLSGNPLPDRDLTCSVDRILTDALSWQLSRIYK